MISIEIVEGCNFKCYFCRAKDIDKYSFMDRDLFKRVINEAKELGITKLNLVTTKGEPFLHPDIYEMLDYADKNMNEILIFTNGTAINVDKLEKVNRMNTSLCISYYGTSDEGFTKLTNMNSKQREIVDRKIAELKNKSIAVEVQLRPEDYKFDYDGDPVEVDFDFNTKCKYHYHPKIFIDGSISFCSFAREEWLNVNELLYDNVAEKTLKEVLTDPIRYKFYESQSICKSGCSGCMRECYTKTTLTGIKLIAQSKVRYNESKKDTDERYAKLEKAITDANV